MGYSAMINSLQYNKKDIAVNKIHLFSLIIINIFLTPFSHAKELAIMPVENDSVIYSGVVELDEKYTANEIFEAADIWLKKAVNLRKMGGKQSMAMMMGGISVKPIMSQLESNMRSREKLLSKKPGREITYNFLQYYQAQKGFAIRTLLLDSDLNLQFKDGKYRYELTDFDYQHYNHYTGSQNRIYAMGDKCGANGSLYQLQNICNKANGDRKKALTAIDADIQEFLEEMHVGILAAVTPQEQEDW
jgi:hypothetical protein|tara:strand:+ start:14 stop:751 length:738 start_codon:yes stop_codon:yes gene_type:complete